MAQHALTPGDYTTLHTTRFDSKEVSLRPITRDFLVTAAGSVAPAFTPGIADVSTLSHGSQMSGSGLPSRDQRGRDSLLATVR